jgi:L-rhamnose mutarotase
LVTAPAKKQAVRYGMITGIKPEKLEYYKELHAQPWPVVLAKIKECHIENYSIHLQNKRISIIYSLILNTPALISEKT